MERNRQGSREKQIVGVRVAHLVEDGEVIGLGTGSTIAYAIRELGRMVEEEGFDILGVPTSYQSRFLTVESGIPLTTLDEHPHLDIALDGADQVEYGLSAIKGGGAAHTLEKIVARSSKRFVIAVDEGKLVEQLKHPVPLEVLPPALNLVREQIEALGGKPMLRYALRKDGPVITDNGNFIIDADFGVITSPERLSEELSRCTGVVEHGIFTFAREVYIGRVDGSVEVMRR